MVYLAPTEGFHSQPQIRPCSFHPLSEPFPCPILSPKRICWKSIMKGFVELTSGHASALLQADARSYWDIIKNCLVSTLVRLNPLTVKVALLHWSCWGHNYWAGSNSEGAIPKTAAQIKKFQVGASLVRLEEVEVAELIEDPELLSSDQKQQLQPSKSQWASPLIMAHKKDVTHCFCVDYHHLNLVTKLSRYMSPPSVDDQLNQLGKACYIFNFSSGIRI